MTDAIPLYLASLSPRRRQLLDQIVQPLGLSFELLAPDDQEDAESLEQVLPEESPEDYVQRVTLAKAKAGEARRIRRDRPRGLILASDTTVALDGQILGKPADPVEAKAMLRALSGRAHEVLTAVALVGPNGLELALSRSQVWFAPLGEDWIDWVVATGEPMDKAGAYAIQGYAGVQITRIDGSPSGIMGLPLHETQTLLRRTLNR